MQEENMDTSPDLFLDEIYYRWSFYKGSPINPPIYFNSS
jgi:hypothetical protein